jgi:predicted ester cyclase
VTDTHPDAASRAEQGMNQEGEAVELVDRMIDSLNRSEIEPQKEFWAEDMKWYGPAGMGTMHNIQEFHDNLQRPFQHAFPRKYADDAIRFGSGSWAAAHGYQHTFHDGDWLGIPATGLPIKLRYMDIWRSENGKLVENWVLVDIIDFLNQIGVDVLALVRAAIDRGEIVLPTPEDTASAASEPTA